MKEQSVKIQSLCYNYDCEIEHVVKCTLCNRIDPCDCRSIQSHVGLCLAHLTQTSQLGVHI